MWSSFVMANILWTILSIPLITLPAATAGLFAFMSARARGIHCDLFGTFFGAMRRLWLKSMLLMIVNMLVGGLIALNISIFPHMNTSSDPLAFIARSVTVFVGLALLLVNMYAWHLLVLFDEVPLSHVLMSSFRLVVAHPWWSLGILITTSVPVLISLLLPRAIFLLGTISSCAFIITWGTWRIIRRHFPDDEPVTEG